MNTTQEKVHPIKQSTTTKWPNANPSTNKTTTTTGTATATTTTSIKFPPTKAQQLKPAIRYRPVPPPKHHHRHRHRRSSRQCCTCRCCFLTILWTTFLIIAFLILAAITAAMFYAFYRPRPPSFSLSTPHFTELNLTSAAQFTTKMNLTMITTNPNDKITLYYNPLNITVSAIVHKQSINIAQGSFPAFVQFGKNKTSLFTVIKNDNIIMDDGSLEILKSRLKGKNKKLDLKVDIETEMRSEFGNKMKTKKVGLRVYCDGVKAHYDSSVDTNGVKCKVHLFVRLLEWEIPI